jgi:hypothetical protein
MVMMVMMVMMYHLQKKGSHTPCICHIYISYTPPDMHISILEQKEEKPLHDLTSIT